MDETNRSENMRERINLLKQDLNKIIVKFVSEQGVDVEISSTTKTTEERVGFKKRHAVTVETNVKINT